MAKHPTSRLPSYKPMLASPARADDHHAPWAEIKWDGYRCLAYVYEADTKLVSRGGKDISAFFPELLSLHIQAGGSRCIIDGELVAFVDGRPSFSHLQQRVGERHWRRTPNARACPVILMAFDLLYLQDKPLVSAPLVDRRSQLEKVIAPDAFVQFSQVYEASVPALLEKAAALDLEGLILKDPDSPYVPGERTNYWRKLKIRRTLLAPIVGFTEQRNAIKALLLASSSLQYIGRVGTGFSERQRKILYEQLQPLRQPDSPLSVLPPDIPADAVWVTPVFTSRINYLELTPQGRLRHPSFQGLVE